MTSAAEVTHPDDKDADITAKVTALKDSGNQELQQGHFLKAVDYYSQGLELDPTNAILLSNRAFVYIKIENYGLALSDSEGALAVDPSYAKAYYRRASANLALGHTKLARKDLKQVCKLKPKDRDARAKLAACEKAIKEEAFLKAIEAEHSAPLSQTFQPSTIAFNAQTYEGPQLSKYVESNDNINDDSEKTAKTLTNSELTDEQEQELFQPGNSPRQFLLDCEEFMKKENQVHKRYVARVLLSCKKLFEETPSLMNVSIPNEVPTPQSDAQQQQKQLPRLTVCGDTHGQYYDLINIFENVNGGYPHANNPYIFNGDFVDRGSFSVEVILALLLFKLHDPNCIYLTRGNHETKNMNKIYGFEGEVKHKYDDKIFALFLEVFEWLPLAAVIEGEVFVTHGGLPSNLDPITSLDDIAKIKRGMEPPETGLMSDLLWSDPQPFPGKSPSKRGVGFSFGPDITEAFLNHNKLKLLVRSHEVKDEGYLVEHGGKTITVFSAPNYCDTMGNKGALLRFSKNTSNDSGVVALPPEFVQYTAVPHPNVKPMQYAVGMGGLFQ